MKPTFWMLYREGGLPPTRQHETLQLAQLEARRLLEEVDARSPIYILQAIEKASLKEVLQRNYVPKERVKVLVEAAEPFAKGFFVDPYQSHQAGEAARQHLLIALAQLRLLEAKEEKP